MAPYFGLRSGFAIRLGLSKSLKKVVPGIRYFRTWQAARHYVLSGSFASPDEKQAISHHQLDLVIYTDGGQRNVNDGAWAYSINDAHRQIKFASKYIITKNNNYCEVEAVIQALRELRYRHCRRLRLQLDTDSVSVKSIADDLRHGVSIYRIEHNTDWQTRQLRTFRRLLRKFKHLRIHQIKGHSGVIGNQFVDQLCSRAMCVRYRDGYDPFINIPARRPDCRDESPS